MDFPKLKEELKEIIKIVEDCPEKFQDKCFEILLNKLLEKENVNKNNVDEKKVEPPESSDKNGNITGQEIELKNIHLKVNKFLTKHSLNVIQLNNLFYKENDSYMPLYEDLKTTKASEVQIRVALLQSFKNSLDEGNFTFDGEEVRSECQTRKSYDAGNFTANFNNNSALFDGFSKYDKKDSKINLSVKGKEELSKIIKLLANNDD